MQRTLVVIPARMQSTRLPNKPLVDIAGEPMIVHVWRRAMAAEVGRVVVATDTEEIVAAVRKVGGEAVMTRADHASGSDRVFEAVNRVDPEAASRASRRSVGVARPHRPAVPTSRTGGTLYQNSWITITVPLPTTYGATGLQPAGETEGGWWKIRYTVNSANDTTTWEVNLRGNPVHLVIP